MNSFYGGKPGFSFIIVKSFTSVKEMIENFKQGPRYTEVHYDEHVLINTENKNDPNNGHIYRRGYDYSNKMGGAIYIGSIVGPAGRAPMLELTTIEEVKEKQNIENFEDRYSEGEYSIPASLIPGKDEYGYNDSVEWACCCIRNENNEDSTAYIGFKFPYTVIDFIAKSVDPYYNRDSNNSEFSNLNLMSRIDDQQHPFYEKWHINVPKGIKGDTFKNFRIITANSSIQNYTGQQDDIDNNRKILVYDYYRYDKNSKGEPVSLYLGDYNIINNIIINENGTITFKYSHDNDLVYDKLFKWIKEITLNKDTGHFTVVYNHDYDNNGEPTIYETDLNWVKNISLENDGTILIHYTSGEPEILDTKLKWISNVYIGNTDDTGEPGTGDQKIHIQYNTGSTSIIGQPLNYIIETAITPDYHYIVYYSDPALRRQIVDKKENYVYNNKEDWHDLGSIKDDSGILIGLNILESESELLKTIEGSIQYLNERYPGGLGEPNTDNNLKGKIVTVGEENGNKKLYAFDYSYVVIGTYKGWYYLGSLGDSSADNHFMFSTLDATDLEDKQNKLNSNGIWFVLTEE